MRIREGKIIAGVCNGFAQYFGWDVTMIRLVWIFLVIFAGTGIIAYIIMWIIMPEKQT